MGLGLAVLEIELNIDTPACTISMAGLYFSLCKTGYSLSTSCARPVCRSFLSALFQPSNYAPEHLSAIVEIHASLASHECQKYLQAWPLMNVRNTREPGLSWMAAGRRQADMQITMHTLDQYPPALNQSTSSLSHTYTRQNSRCSAPRSICTHARSTSL